MIIQRASVASHTEGKSVILTVHTLARSVLIICVQVFVREEMKEEHWQWVQPQQKKIWKVDSPSFYSPCIMREQQMGDFYLTFLSGIPERHWIFQEIQTLFSGDQEKRRRKGNHCYMDLLCSINHKDDRSHTQQLPYADKYAKTPAYQRILQNEEINKWEEQD